MTTFTKAAAPSIKQHMGPIEQHLVRKHPSNRVHPQQFNNCCNTGVTVKFPHLSKGHPDIK